MKKKQSNYLNTVMQQAEALPSKDDSVRTSKLYVYDLSGEDSKTLDYRVYTKSVEKKFVRYIESIDRKTYRDYLNNLILDETYVREIIEYWKEEERNYLAGALEPLTRSPQYLQKYKGFIDEKAQIAQISILVNQIPDHVFYLCATDEDKAEFEPIEVEFKETRFPNKDGVQL